MSMVLGGDERVLHILCSLMSGSLSVSSIPVLIGWSISCIPVLMDWHFCWRPCPTVVSIFSRGIPHSWSLLLITSANLTFKVSDKITCYFCSLSFVHDIKPKIWENLGKMKWIQFFRKEWFFCLLHVVYKGKIHMYPERLNSYIIFSAVQI